MMMELAGRQETGERNGELCEQSSKAEWPLDTKPPPEKSLNRLQRVRSNKGWNERGITFERPLGAHRRRVEQRDALRASRTIAACVVGLGSLWPIHGLPQADTGTYPYTRTQTER